MKTTLRTELPVLLLAFAGLAACGNPNPGADAASEAATEAGGMDDVVTPSEAGGTDASADARMGTCVVQGGEFCFQLPDAPVVLGNAEAGTANFSCPEFMVVNSTAPIAVTGSVKDFQTDSPIPNAAVSVFNSDDFSTTPTAMATSNAMGNFMMTLPAGTPNRLFWRMVVSDGLDTYALDDTFAAGRTMITSNRNSVSRSTANGIAALIGITRRMGTGVVAGAVEDCNGRELMNVVATLTTAPATSAAGLAFVPQAQTYYFANGLPVRRATPAIETSSDGLFVFIQVPPSAGSARYYVQAWGFRTAADVMRGAAGLTLLAQRPLPALADSVMSLALTARAP